MHNSICVRFLFCRIWFLDVESYFPRPRIVFECRQILISAPENIFSANTYVFTMCAHENMISSVQFLISMEENKISAGGRARRLRFWHVRFLFLISKIGFAGRILFLICKICFEIKNRIGFSEWLVRNPILNLQNTLSHNKKNTIP